jgi:excisionase family DNA binding protein
MDDFLSAADAARLLGVVPATVRQMERDGRLPAQRTAGGMRLFRREDVERLRDARTARHQTARCIPHKEDNDEQA